MSKRTQTAHQHSRTRTLRAQNRQIAAETFVIASKKAGTPVPERVTKLAQMRTGESR